MIPRDNLNVQSIERPQGALISNTAGHLFYEALFFYASRPRRRSEDEHLQLIEAKRELHGLLVVGDHAWRRPQFRVSDDTLLMMLEAGEYYRIHGMTPGRRAYLELALQEARAAARRGDATDFPLVHPRAGCLKDLIAGALTVLVILTAGVLANCIWGG